MIFEEIVDSLSYFFVMHIGSILVTHNLLKNLFGGNDSQCRLVRLEDQKHESLLPLGHAGISGEFADLVSADGLHLTLFDSRGILIHIKLEELLVKRDDRALDSWLSILLNDLLHSTCCLHVEIDLLNRVIL